MKAPCHDCPDRHPHCHGECERYQTYNAERELIRGDKRQQMNVGDGARIDRLKKIATYNYQTRRK